MKTECVSVSIIKSPTRKLQIGDTFFCLFDFGNTWEVFLTENSTLKSKGSFGKERCIWKAKQRIKIHHFFYLRNKAKITELLRNISHLYGSERLKISALIKNRLKIRMTWTNHLSINEILEGLQTICKIIFNIKK